MRDKRSILLVEDDDIDIMTVQRALRDLKVTNPLEITNDGEEALTFLEANKAYLPGLILLDINMPRMNGIEFLREMKKDPVFRLVPVVIMTTSQEQRDKIESFNLGVAGYMVKPVDYLKFVEMVRTIDFYWTLSETAL